MVLPRLPAAGTGVTALPPAFLAGHWSDHDRWTGCTVVLAPEGAVSSCEVRGGGPDHDLVHVDIRRVQQTAFFRRRQHGDRVGRASGAEVGSLQRIDRDVHLRVNLPFGPTAPQRLADIEHRRLVPFSLADYDGAAHLEPVELFAHRFHGHLVGVFSLSVSHGPRRCDGRFLRDAQESDLETRFHDFFRANCSRKSPEIDCALRSASARSLQRSERYPS